MRSSGSVLFAIIAVLVAVGSVAVAGPVVNSKFPEGMPWMVAGWALVASVGVADGIWLTRCHGKPGSGFMVALVAGMLARLVLIGGGAALAFRYGGNRPWGFLAGAAAGFFPLQVFEIVWFLIFRPRDRQVQQ